MSKEFDSESVERALPRSERRRLVRQAKNTSPERRKTLQEEGLAAFVNRVGLETLEEMMEEDINLACGVAEKWEQAPVTRLGNRNGTAPGVVWVGGRSARIQRPRAVKSEGGEIVLPSYQATQDPTFLSEAILTATILGVSLRKYRPNVMANFPMEAGRESPGLSKSAIGRRFIAAADRFASRYLKRSLLQRFLVVWIDGVSAGEHGFMSAVGLTVSGEKQVLGLRQGSTENATLYSEFLEDLVGRGFSTQHGTLFVVDGSPAIAKALREVFGADVLIQRCQVHKKRNLMDKLPEGAKDTVSANLAEVFQAETMTLALAKAEMLARNLESQQHTAAADSLREGGPELFTCCRLGIPVELWGSLTNTNVIESAFSIYEAATHRVKRWRNGQQVNRWAAGSLYMAEKAFKPLGSPALLSRLARALEQAKTVAGKPALLARTG